MADTKMYTTKAIVPKYSDQVAAEPSNPRLTLRPFRPDDLDAFHILRNQIEVMKWTSKGIVDANLDETKDWMNRFLDIENKFDLPSDFKSTYRRYNEATTDVTSDTKDSPDKSPDAPDNTKVQISRSYAFVVDFVEDGCARIVGTMAVLNTGEPAIGYMFFKEEWGKGFASTTAAALIESWYKLEREVVVVPEAQRERVQKIYSLAEVPLGQDTLPEILYAVTEATNGASGRILEKLGFKVEREYHVEEHGQSVPLKDWFRIQHVDR